MKYPSICKSCAYQGYSPEICALHRKHLQKQSGECARAPRPVKGRYVSGTTFVAGVCAGVLTSVVGLSVACLAGVKALCGTAASAKLVTGAGAAGGVTGMTLKKRPARSSAKGTSVAPRHGFDDEGEFPCPPL
ncbi:hypothetical protein NNJEOMEG_00153 [Fundidesulfovibrio magnetotacticus]|uniref:Magnetosome protein Mad7 n=1 Tax=Fundidesulfovibrio magnetotacticus TaxID=2730080 RepID=A0A6V8LQC7_9BACT|nr:hypothetical protein [Fundidesulfovibrio magnetotacticus]GFK92329.1 hypothetical protein NNJEOMEG_00153 [Fundidesulfovibrio magnetotacticus]